VECADECELVDALGCKRSAIAVSVLTCGKTIAAAEMNDEGWRHFTDIWERDITLSVFVGGEYVLLISTVEKLGSGSTEELFVSRDDKNLVSLAVFVDIEVQTVVE
jgi:hypothetical protein